MRVSSPGWAAVCVCWGDEGAEAGPLVAGEGLCPPHAPCHLAGFSRDYRDDVAEQLLSLKDGLEHPDPTILFHTCHSIAQVPANGHCSSSLMYGLCGCQLGRQGGLIRVACPAPPPLMHLLGSPSGAQWGVAGAQLLTPQG